VKNGACACGQCQHQLCAKRVPIFSSLDEEELNKVVGLIVRRQYVKGETILTEGSELNSLVIVNRGMVKAFRYTQEGKEQILYIFSEGDFFGEKNLLSRQAAAYHVEALEPTHICMIRSKDFQELIREYPDISLKIISELIRRLNRLENAVRNMGTKNAETRVGAVLLEFAEKYGTSHPAGIQFDLPFSREGIANYIGAARETVSRRLNHLQEEGVIDMVGNKRIIIKNEEALREDQE
jgi:CRP/FNR family transcriptional regulator